jgi:hypothetical protein
MMRLYPSIPHFKWQQILFLYNSRMTWKGIIKTADLDISPAVLRNRFIKKFPELSNKTRKSKLGKRVLSCPIALTPVQIEWLVKESYRRKTSRSEIIRRLLDHEMKKDQAYATE